MHLLALNPLFLVDVTISPVFREKIFFSILEAAFRMQPELTHAILRPWVTQPARRTRPGKSHLELPAGRECCKILRYPLLASFPSRNRFIVNLTTMINIKMEFFVRFSFFVFRISNFRFSLFGCFLNRRWCSPKGS